MAAPSAGWAEVCDKMRPDWTPGSAPSVVSEAIALGTTLPSLVLFVATLLCARFRLQWGALVVVLLWTGWISVLLYLPRSDVQAMAIAEGCIASPGLFIALVTGLCIGLILYTVPRPGRR